MSNTNGKQRRSFTAAFKAEVVLALLTGQKTQAELCRQYDLSPTLLGQWKDTLVSNAASAFKSEGTSGGDPSRVAELERALGRATLENEILKKGIEFVEPERRKEIVKMRHESNPTWSVSSMCGVLRVPRSRFYYQSTAKEEKPIQAAISQVAGAWPRYGSERITAQLRREGTTFEGKPIGERRVRRLMREMGLLAQAGLHAQSPTSGKSERQTATILCLDSKTWLKACRSSVPTRSGSRTSRMLP